MIIQYTQISTSRFEEYGGRPKLDGGTTYTQPDGRRMPFAPGQVWVVLAPDSHASYVNAAAV